MRGLDSISKHNYFMRVGVNDVEIARWDEVIKSVGYYMSFLKSILLT